HDLVWEMDPTGVITYVTARSEEVLGEVPDCLIGRTVFEFIPPDFREAARAVLRRAVATGSGWTDQRYPVLHRDGGTRWVETTGIGHVGPNGEVGGFTATTRLLNEETARVVSLDQARRRVEQVLADRTIDTVFQPIVDLATGRVIGFEGLSRFSYDPVRPPDQWFADAEAVGLIVDLDMLAVQTTLLAAARLPRDAYVSVNVAPATLLSGRLAAALATAPVPARRIVFEVTEHVSIDDYDGLCTAVAEVRRLGSRLAVDDAGAGYASFRHILRLGPDIIKLDQALIRGIDADPARRALASALVMFAAEMNARVVAEGIETHDELDIVDTLGIHAVQGYLVGHPSAAVVGQPHPALARGGPRGATTAD
ncbi:MAG TPA: EAL domain-containing protein, partial [Acidimicrobiales bacterium]|nr:EAL domain-containing protein [Acidimicrobiales bacterium]